MTERVPVQVFPPGEYIREELEERGWTQIDLAEILGRPLQLVNEIILDKRSITPETAKGLAEAFGTSAQLWLNLQAAWELYRSRNIAPDPAISLRARIYSVGPIKEMVKRGWIQHSRDPEVLEQRILEFFGTTDLDEPPLPVAARMSTAYDAFSPSQWAWLCRARQLGKVVPVQGRFEPGESARLLQRLRALMRDPEEVRHVPRILGEAGIRFVVLEHLAKTRIDGACLWLDTKAPVIAISLRYDRIDYFWFTVMHELKHALDEDGLKNGVLTVDIDLVGAAPVDRESRPDFEKEADEFAENALIPKAELEDFVIRKQPLFSENAIRGFAALHGIHAGIVVGQLHHRVGDYAKRRRLLVKVRDYITGSALTDGWGHTVPAIS